MKAKTVKQIAEEYSDKASNLCLGRDNFDVLEIDVAVEAMKEFAKEEVKKENSRLHDRFIEVMPVGYFDSTKEFLELKDLIFNETFDLYEKPKKKKDLLCVNCSKKLPGYLKFKHFECRQKQNELK